MPLALRFILSLARGSARSTVSLAHGGARPLVSLARFGLPRSALPWLACAQLVLGVTASALAQPLGELVVVPFGVSDVSDEIEATALLEAELVNQRVGVISLHDARDRFTARSRPPLTPSDTDLDVLAREAREAIEHVAFGRTAAAQQSVREVIARAERTLESLNRETATARQILDACLSLVRSSLQSGKRDLALEQATRCRRLVPDLAPSEAAHPANVVGVLAEADNLLRRMRIGNLTVRSAPESNCSVYLNGRHLGTTPFHIDRAAAGDYRVQVECGKSLARVHVVQLGDEPVSLLVDTQFDRAVGSDPRLLLRYESEDDARAEVVSHAIQLGREVGADDVVLVSLARDKAELLRVHVEQQRLVARASAPWNGRQGFAGPALERAIRALAEGRIVGDPRVEPTPRKAPEPSRAPDPPRAEPAASLGPAEVEARAGTPERNGRAAYGPRASGVQEETSAAPQLPRAVRRAGFALLGISAGVFTLGLGFDARAQLLHNDLAEEGTRLSQEEGTAGDSANGEQQEQFERAQTLRWVGLGGPVLALATTFMVIQPRPSVPWWGYALGGVGLGLVAVGAQQIAVRSDCKLYDTQRVCWRERDSMARGVMLLAAAVPLLNVPLVQIARRAPSSSLALLLGSRAGGFELLLRAVH